MFVLFIAFVMALPIADAAPAAEGADPLAERSVGIGLGTTFNPFFTDSSFEWPGLDRLSVRVHLNEHLALEPAAVLRFDRVDNDPNSRAQSLQTGAELGLRWYAASHGPVHLAGLAGAGASRSSTRQSADGGESKTAHTDVFAQAGLGVEWTPSNTWALGLDMQNPLFHFSRALSEAEGSRTSRATAWSAGMSFEPQLSLMAHLYF